MPRTKRWTRESYENGYQLVSLSSWKYFSDYINQVLLDYKSYVYRGQANAKWELVSTLDRLIGRASKQSRVSLREKQLENFKLAVRGRRGSNPPQLKDDNAWWTLGQHHGLKTPLLDWTKSPFVALYFAFIEELRTKVEFRTVYALHEHAVQKKSASLELNVRLDQVAELPTQTELTRALSRTKPEVDKVEIIQPMSDENARLVSQNALFASVPIGQSIEQWVKEKFVDVGQDIILMKIVIPNKDRDSCLQLLNRMNINHLSLFPDLTGASIHCNNDLSIENY